MTSKHDYSHKLKGHHHSDETIISTDIYYPLSFEFREKRSEGSFS
jgi:hypothetical protein